MASKKLLSLLSIFLIIIVVLSSVVVYQNLIIPEVQAQSYTSLGLSVTPEGQSFKLGVNESKTFTATATNGTAPFTYTWTLHPSGNFTISINGENQEVTNASSVTVSGSELTLCYPQATEEYVSVQAQVTDDNGFTGSLLQPFIVADPYTSPGYKFDASTATASYIIQTDGLGWYRAIEGTTGTIKWSSTNANTVMQQAETSMTTGGEIALGKGSFTFTDTFVINNPNIWLHGQGRYATEIMLSNTARDANKNVINITSAVYSKISDLTISGSTTASPSTSGIGILKTNSWQSYIQDITIRRCGGAGLSIGSPSIYATECTHVTDIEIEDCGPDVAIYGYDNFFTSCDFGNPRGPAVASYGTAWMMTNCEIWGLENSTQAFAITNGNEITVSNCFITEFQDQVIAITSDNDNPRNIRFDGITCRDNCRAGTAVIYIRASDTNTAKNLTFTNFNVIPLTATPTYFIEGDLGVGGTGVIDYVTIANNNVQGVSSVFITQNLGLHSIAYGNTGLSTSSGVITYPISSAGNLLVDGGDTASNFVNNTVYTNYATAKTIYFWGQPIDTILVNGQWVGLAQADQTTTVRLQPGDTLKILYSGTQPYAQVYSGQNS